MLERGLVGFTMRAGLLSRESSTEGHLSYILLALVGAAVFFMAAGTNQVFADSALQHAPDAPAASLGGQTYSRQVTDSVSVASQFDNPASRNFASRTFARGISDGVGVASEFGGPAGQTSTSQARTFGPQQPAGQRIDPTQRLLLGNNKVDNRLYGAGSVAQKGTPVAEMTTMDAGEMDFAELATLGDGEDPDSHRLLQAVMDVSSTSSSVQGMIVYSNAVSGVYLFAVIAMVVNKSPAFARAKRKTVNLGAGRVAVITTRDSSRERLMVIVIAAVAAASVMSLAGPAVGEAFADTNRAAIAYRSTAGDNGDPKYREWDPVNLAWSSEVAIDKTSAADITHAWLEFSPTSTKRVIVTYSGQSGDGGLDSYVCYSACLDPNSWTFTDNFAVLPTYANPADQRPFDIEYERTSGDLLVVYDYAEAGSSNTDDLFYRVMTDSQTSFGSENTINDTNNADTAAVYTFMRVASRKTSGSDQLALIAIDATNSDAVAIRWDGSAWVTTAGQQTELTATVSATIEEATDIAYETNSGDIVIVAGEGSSMRHNTYNAGTGTWGSSSTSTGTWGVGTINWLQLIPNPTSSSNEIFLIGSGSSSDLDSAYWSGSSWTDNAEHETSLDTHGNRNFDFVWETGTSSGLLAWGADTGFIEFKRFTAPNTFSASGTYADDGTHTVLEFASNPTTTDTVAALGLAVDNGNDISGIRWDGGSNSPDATANDDITLVSSNARRPFTIDFQEVPAVARLVSDTITLSDSVSAVKIKSASVAQTLTVSDSVSAALSGKSITQALAISDSIAISLTITFPVADSFAAADSIGAAMTYERVIAQTVTVSDSASRSETNLAAISYRSDDGVDTSQSPKYREWNVVTRSWGSQVELESSGSAIRNAWIEFSPISSKRVIVVLSSDGTLDSYACDNGCTDPAKWTVTHDFVDLWITEPAAQWRPFDIEFENTSGDLLIVYDRNDGGDPDTDLFYRIMPDSSYAFGAEGVLNDTGPSVVDNIYSFVRMDARRMSGSDDIGLIALAETNNRAIAWYWNGSTNTFGNENELTSDVSSTDYEAIGIGFETFTGDLVAVAGQGNTDVIYSEFGGSSWTAEASVGAIDVGRVRWIRYVPNANPGSNSAFLAVSGFTGSQHQLDSAHWSGTIWSVYNGGTRHDANIDDSATRVFDFAWDNLGDALRGVMVYGTTSGSLTFKRYAEPNTWTAATTFSDDGTHPWISLNESSNPITADLTSVLGAAIDDGSDVGGLKWEGAPPVVNPNSAGDDGITTSGSSASESFHIDYRHSTLIKKFPTETVTVTDSVTGRLSIANMSDSVTVAESLIAEKGSLAESSAAAAVYKSNTGVALLNSPKYREWDPATQSWSAEVQLSNIGSPMRDGRLRFSPDSSLRAVVTHSDDATLNLFACDNLCTNASSWTFVAADFADTGTAAALEPYRPYETMFETTGERMLIVYDKELTENADFYYRTFDGTTLSEEFSYDLGGNNDTEEIRYFRLAANPTTNEMVLTVMQVDGGSNYYALVWDGTAWGNQLTITGTMSTQNKDGESIGVAYEASGAAVVVSGSGANDLAYARWNGSSWSSVSITDPNPASGNDVKFVSVQGDPAGSSDRVMVCQSGDLGGLSCSQFSAGVPGSWTVITDDIGTSEGRAFDYVYHPAGTTGMLLSATSSAGALQYRTFNGTAFGSPYSAASAGTHTWVSASPAYSANDYVNALFLESNSNFDTGALKYKANIVTPIGDASLTADSQNETHEGLHHEFQKSKRVKRAIADTVTVAEVVTRTTAKGLLDVLAIADSIARIFAGTRAQSESLAVTDGIARSTAFVRPVADTLALLDSPTRRLNYARSTSETLTTGETVARRLTASRSADDDVTAADTASRTIHYQRSNNDSLAVTDGVARTLAFSSSLAESLAISDGIVRTHRPFSSLSDSVQVTDSVTRVLVASPSIAESMTVDDSIARTVVFVRAASDSVTITDDVTRTIVFARSLSDIVTVADLANRTIIVTRATSDSIPVSDNIVRATAHARAIAEAVAMADSVARTIVIAKAMSDTISVTETPARTYNASRSLADAVTVMDAIARATASARSISDTITVTDSPAGTVSFAMSMADSLSLADAISAIISYARSIADSASVTDSVARTYATSRPIADAVSIADLAAGAAAYIRSVSDALTIADSIARSNPFARAVSDTLTVTDATTIAVSKSASETLAVTDTIVRTVSLQSSVSDTVAAIDVVARAHSASRSLADSVSITAAAVDMESFARSISDTVAVADSIARALSSARTVSDALATTDGIATAASFAKPVADTVAVTDAISVALSASRSLSDNLSVAEAPARAVSYAMSVADAVNLADAVTTSEAYTVTVADTVAAADTIARTAAFARSISDSVAVGELVGRNNLNSRSVADSLTVAETVVANVALNVLLSDSLAITDLAAPHTSLTRSISDSVTGADTIGRMYGSARSISDTLSTTDLAGHTEAVVKSIAETISIADSITTSEAYNASTADSLAAADAIARTVSFARFISDSVTVAELATTNNFTAKSVSDSLALADAVSAAVALERSLSDPLAVTDLIATKTSASRSAAETLAVTDVVGRTVSFARAIAEPVAITEELAAKASSSRLVSDSLTVADGIVATVSATRLASDALAVTDTAWRAIFASRQISDSLTVTDVASAKVGLRTVSDAVTVSDAIAAKITARMISDNLVMTDAITARITTISISDTLNVADLVSAKVTARSISDQLAIADTVTAKIGSRSIADSVIVADSVSALVTGRSASDAVIVADAVKATVNFRLADSVTVTDAVTMSVTRSIADSVTIADTAARAFTTSRSISEPLSVADLVAPSMVYARSMSDALAVTDNITRSLTFARAIVDMLSAADAVGTAVSYARSIADLLSTTDGVTRTVVFKRSITDAVVVADTATRTNLESRSVSDALTVADDANRLLTVSRSAPEALSIADSIARKVTIGRTVADSAIMTDTTSVALAVSRSAADGVAVTDTASAKLVVQRVITDGVSLADGVSAKTQTKREMADTLSLGDNVEKSAKYGLADAVSVADQVDVRLRPVSNVADQMTFQDKVSMSVTRAVSDSLAVQDAARRASVNVTIVDSLSVTEQPRIASVAIHLADSLGVADSARTTSLAVSIADSLAVADQTRIGDVTVNISDALAIADTARPSSLSVNIVESVTITDTARSFEPSRTVDTVIVTDAISIHLNRVLADAVSVSDNIGFVAGDKFAASIADSLAIADAVAITSGKLVSINDPITIGAALTDVSVHLNLNFAEEFVLGECTPFACNLVWHGYEGLGLAAGISPPPATVDVLTVTDSIVRRLIGSSVPNPSDSVAFSDSVSARIIGILVVDKKENAGPLPSTPIIGNFTYTGNAADLKAQIQPVPIPINGTVVRPDLPSDVTILRTFHVPIVPNAVIPGDDAIVTETQKEVPALSNMFMRLNFEETPQLNEHKDFIKTLDIEFTPKVNSTDFALVVSVIDGPPGIAPLPVEELRPIYVDVRWVGSFPGSESPAVQTYYQNPPTFTFTVNDQWVAEQEANRDSNGVPTLKLWLLDDGTNKWEQITSITRPVAGVDGTYTFVATLPHFSDYAITATRVPPSSGGTQGGNPSPGPVPPVVGTALVVNLLESLAVGDSQDSVPVEVIEEFGEKKLTVRIADAVAIFTKPVSYRTFQVGDVEVRITVQDVRQESVIPPKATATFLVEMDNLGGKEEEFTLNFWYYDQSGNRPYESSQVAEIGPHESRKLLVDVPFTEPGVFEVTAEARSIPGGDLVNTAQLTVTIPWLAINLYVLVVVAVAILAASGGVMAVLLRGGLAGAGAGTALFLLARKRKPTMRVTDRLASVEEEYDIVVEVRQREEQGGQAVFDLEIVNRSRRTHDFMLKYWAADSSGIRMSEHSEKVRIKGRATDVRVAQVVLPPGRNIFVAEAGPVSEKQARWSHAGVRVKDD